MAARLRPGDVVAFLGPSLPADEARRIAPCRVLPPARAGDLLAVLPERPLAIALVDGLFDTTPSVWHHEVLAAQDAGVQVFGGGSMGALRAAELGAQGVVGVGRVFGWYRDGAVVDDGEVALLHAGADDGHRPLTLPLVQVRAAAEAAVRAGLLPSRAARGLVAAAAGIHYAERGWRPVLDAAALAPDLRDRVARFVAQVPDVKAEDARACVEAAAAFARARRRGAPPPPRPATAAVSSHLRRLRLDRARAVLPDGRAAPSGAVVAALAGRPGAGRVAIEGLRRALVAALARSLGLEVTADEAAAAERAWLSRLGVARRGRDAVLAACALDEGAARRVAEDLALEAKLLGMAERVVPDGPAWEEGLALGARLTGEWVEVAAEVAAETAATLPRGDGGRTRPASRPRSRSRSRSRSRR
jgi:hypothetical protein